MSYTLWTGNGLEIYNIYLKNITVEQVGFINIGGIFEKTDFYTEHRAVAYIFRIYDRNVICPDRPEQLMGPGIGKLSDGTVTGLVVALGKHQETGGFFFDDQNVDSSKVTIAHPASIWIATHYTGECATIGKQVVREHQGKFHEMCCTHTADGKQEMALCKEHIFKFILPNVAEAYALEILSMDMEYESKHKK